MSRIGKKPIAIPNGTTVSVLNNVVKVKGPLGELSRNFRPIIGIAIDNNQVILTPKRTGVEVSAMWGTASSHVNNMINGVNKAFEKKLILEGIGFKSEVKGKKMVFSLGFSHPVEMDIPEGLKVTAEKNLITVSGIDKELVGQFAAKVRDLKKAEPYKGKGMRYEKEVIRRKEGKKAA
ncbi:MAG: 50S ribosomal protein L6 [Candidatus Paceibacterota bacterium]|jgi:large subunit ribosomal protein L6